MGSFFSSGVSHSGTSNSTDEESSIDTLKNVTGLSNTNTTTQNSGSINTSNTNTFAGTAGSVNTSVTGPSSSSTVNSGRVDTSQVMLSDEAVNHITDQLLSSNQGLAAVSSGQKAAGGYNSTATTLLTNDLLSSVAGEVAVRGAKTVNTIGGSSSNTYNSGSTTTQNIGATQSYNIAEGVQNIGASTSTSKATTETNTMEDLTGVTTSAKDTNESNTKQEAKGGWIVCTELVKQKRMPVKYYFLGLRVFDSYDARGKQGYYYWAVPAVKHLRAHPDSLLSKVLEVVMVARAEQLAADANYNFARKTVGGFLAKHLLYAGCWILSRTLAKDYKQTSPDEVAYAGR
jgi:hypothetical protein